MPLATLGNRRDRGIEREKKSKMQASSRGYFFISDKEAMVLPVGEIGRLRGARVAV